MRVKVFFGVSLGCLLLLIVANLMLGAVSMDLSRVMNGFSSTSEDYFTIHEYRLPRIILALLVGSMLALAGALVQGVIRNPLASPDILGINHGAGLAAVAFMTFFPAANMMWLPQVALAGGLLAAVLLWYLVGSRSGNVKFAITGVAIAALFASAIDFIMLVHPLDINNALLWLTGSLWGRGWRQVGLILPWVILLPCGVMLAKRINLIDLGEESAVTLGASPNRTKKMAIGISVGLTASCVSICGPISFLGLVSPHLARFLVGGRHQYLLPAAMLVGANILLLADLVARTIDPPIELPAGIVTAILGGPYFLWLLVKMR
ncbi:Fe(3+) dicitrate ABC transporter permease subunit FecD [Marinomonas mediterranea]|jgi:ABC-type Fe3+-siderophore transport system, permease component|uniref:ABC-type transporter, integral membrane subunit n=1 Tax=Marinomonas mediterranea (strain ATCC 700492 / JCM 21426 / NBRC 103028 / MMB-1) TaxID=717774 RepID=F2JX95_MARM1|nr:Fe(3+) dicitrate ABC transporter permease subunit FecD [Marinomonas mediterranea]ADZ90701.1 ABC-type transporter, integral membrane subunit [Marinomonas mediterranea MMB-1]WCN08749.1 Fe(3+) dicitrate ABC transporter permease subunit FecD [Marinomonas mediterranea]WCN12794.1 Fe(3+) dicitrate ABC transporter permease subunit FecD [Marinomonas mediterranea]WCN16864.1 Fe(3+) dicitrate ABC transporter permease subunit FecD [Marinomonas mediterranea MMB-1]